jgi:hypothetical protein
VFLTLKQFFYSKTGCFHVFSCIFIRFHAKTGCFHVFSYVSTLKSSQVVTWRGFQIIECRCEPSVPQTESTFQNKSYIIKGHLPIRPIPWTFCELHCFFKHYRSEKTESTLKPPYRKPFLYNKSNGVYQTKCFNSEQKIRFYRTNED